MKRSSKHILKYQTVCKTKLLDKLFEDYQVDLQHYVDLLWTNQLQLSDRPISSKNIPANVIKHSQYKQILYKQASEIVRSVKSKSGNQSKPVIRKVIINIDNRLYDINTDSKEFDEFIHLRLPYFCQRERRGKSIRNVRNFAMYIRLPIKYHKQSLKYKNWIRCKTIQLQKIKCNYFVTFIYEKDDILKKKEGKVLGIDQGYNKLIVTSNNQIIGNDIKKIYEKISRKKQGSKNFKQAIIERNNKINQLVKTIKINDTKEIVIENLKNIKRNGKTKLKNKLKNGKINKQTFDKLNKFTNKLQRWSHYKVMLRLDKFCEENGILFTKIYPAYTSLTCSLCGFKHLNNRVREKFKCLNCGYETDADYNAAVNISHRGVYSPSTS